MSADRLTVRSTVPRARTPWDARPGPSGGVLRVAAVELAAIAATEHRVKVARVAVEPCASPRIGLHSGTLLTALPGPLSETGTTPTLLHAACSCQAVSSFKRRSVRAARDDTRRMSGPFDAKFTAEQRDAAGEAYVNGQTGREVARLAAAGELKWHGEPLPAFVITPSYVADLGGKIRRRRAGRADTKVAELAPRDAIETLRRRLLNVAHEELAHEERKKPGNRDVERLRQIQRCVLEASKLPGPTDARPPSRDTQDAEGRKGPRTQGGMAGALLKEHRQTAPVQDETQHSRDNGDSSTTHNRAPRSNEQRASGPGVRPSERTPVLGGMVD